ncbi:MAG: HEAT repeat domain-containing protein [Planctomycetes bacterium]|nr:HEAT repeat domain-containing protein [Planctomycetota bacterium]
MTLAATLLFSLVPQVFPGGDIQLPPGRPKAEVAAAEAKLQPQEQFRRDLAEIRLGGDRAERRLRDMARNHGPAQLETWVAEALRSARSDELESLLLAAERLCPGSKLVADELLFQLLSRPLGNATRAALVTLVAMQGDGAGQALRECVRSRVTGVRRHAAELLAPRLRPEDLPFADGLTRESTLDLQMRGVELLAAVGSPEAVVRLIELLAKDPALAGAAAGALVRVGAPAQAPLQRALGTPVADRTPLYAAFVLGELAGAGVPDEAAAVLWPRLRDGELLNRCLAAVCLADLVHRGAPVPVDDGERLVVEALLDVVAPQRFVPNLDLLRRPAEQRLLQLTGRMEGSTDARSWRPYWEQRKAGYVGLRADLAIADEAVPRVRLQLQQDGQSVRLSGVDAGAVETAKDTMDFVLAAAELRALLAQLRTAGFPGASVAPPADLPRTRSLLVEVDGRRALRQAVAGDAAFDRLAAVVQQAVVAQGWQQLRGADEDLVTFWREESAWLAANPDPVVRGKRLAARIVRCWPSWSGGQRTQALQQLLTHAQRHELLDAATAELGLTMLRSQPNLLDLDLRLLEVLAAVPGDAVWRSALQLAASHPGGGRAAVRAVFAVLGEDAVLASLQDADPVVRRVGIDEVVAMRDGRAHARLVEMLRDADPEVQRGAAYACGALRIPAASRALVALVIAETTSPELRRDGMVALGRTGGELAFPVLQGALTAPDQADRAAALQALGDLHEPRAANLLAEFSVLLQGQELGRLAAASLQRQPSRLAVPAMRAQLSAVRDLTVRAGLVQSIAAHQDPAILPELIELMRQPRHGVVAAALFSSTTGVELVDTVGSGSYADQAMLWFQANRQSPQWQWLLDALQKAEVPTTLTAERLQGPADPAVVLELARLLTAAPAPRLWPLCAAVLRSVTGEDFGAVAAHSTEVQREAVAERYRVLAGSMPTKAR